MRFAPIKCFLFLLIPKPVSPSPEGLSLLLSKGQTKTLTPSPHSFSPQNLTRHRFPNTFYPAQLFPSPPKNHPQKRFPLFPQHLTPISSHQSEGGQEKREKREPFNERWPGKDFVVAWGLGRNARKHRPGAAGNEKNTASPQGAAGGLGLRPGNGETSALGFRAGRPRPQAGGPLGLYRYL